MCLILFGYEAHPDYHLVVAANRDEFYQRPTRRAGWWEEFPDILGGKDLKAGGTWLGVNRNGRFSAITNYREPDNILPQAPSRGPLVVNFLTGNDTPQNYLSKLQPEGHKYNGYNLLTYTENSLAWYSNRGDETQILEPGVYGLSNALLDTPWPKVESGKSNLSRILKPGLPVEVNNLFDMLADDSIAPDDELPSTGVSLEWERMLSAMCIKSPEYGTRVSTVVLFGKDGSIFFEERSWVPPGKPLVFEFNR